MLNWLFFERRDFVAVPSCVAYFLEDYRYTLFPLSTSRVVIENAHGKILEYIYQKVLNKSEAADSFIAQTRCYAPKQGFHLRRTVKLDPVAELFIYDLAHRNRALFRRDFQANRRSFGYSFENGKPVSATRGYADFKAAIAAARGRYKWSVKFDIAAYFNSLYHHDLVAWLSEARATQDDVEGFGQFLREANSGRTIDCLPQGIHPCKVIGAEFLKFVDNSMKVKSELLLRFMDDFYLFSDNPHQLSSDFVTIQRLLGDKGLSLNPSKTVFEPEAAEDIAHTVDGIKAGLLRARREILEVSGLVWEMEDDEADVENEDQQIYERLTPEQVDYLLNLLQNADIDEADAELVLVLLRDHGENVLAQLGNFFERFPSLSRNVYNFSKYVSDVEELARLILGFLKSPNVTEDQLFWLAKIAEERLASTSSFGNLVSALYYHANATVISQAKLLEIPDNRFGLPEFRDEQLRVGRSDWLSWSAAVGSRNETPIRRNHVLDYFAKASAMNRIIAECVRALP
jgi:hypothetical protein